MPAGFRKWIRATVGDWKCIERLVRHQTQGSVYSGPPSLGVKMILHVTAGMLKKLSKSGQVSVHKAPEGKVNYYDTTGRLVDWRDRVRMRI